MRVQPRRSGTVKWYKPERGYGFIRPDDGGNDIFVHRSGLAKGVTELLSGEAVEFEDGTGPKGPVAINTELLAGGGGRHAM